MAYLENEGIHPKVLVEIGPRSGSVLGAQVRTAKPYQVRQFLKLVERYDLKLEGEP